MTSTRARLEIRVSPVRTLNAKLLHFLNNGMPDSPLNALTAGIRSSTLSNMQDYIRSDPSLPYPEPATQNQYAII